MWAHAVHGFTHGAYQKRNHKGHFRMCFIPLLHLQEQLGQVCHPQASLLLAAVGPVPLFLKEGKQRMSSSQRVVCGANEPEDS